MFRLQWNTAQSRIKYTFTPNAIGLHLRPKEINTLIHHINRQQNWEDVSLVWTYLFRWNERKDLFRLLASSKLLTASKRKCFHFRKTAGTANGFHSCIAKTLHSTWNRAPKGQAHETEQSAYLEKKNTFWSPWGDYSCYKEILMNLKVCVYLNFMFGCDIIMKLRDEYLLDSREINPILSRFQILRISSHPAY